MQSFKVGQRVTLWWDIRLRRRRRRWWQLRRLQATVHSPCSRVPATIMIARLAAVRAAVVSKNVCWGGRADSPSTASQIADKRKSKTCKQVHSHNESQRPGRRRYADTSRATKGGTSKTCTSKHHKIGYAEQARHTWCFRLTLFNCAISWPAPCKHRGLSATSFG